MKYLKRIDESLNKGYSSEIDTLFDILVDLIDNHDVELNLISGYDEIDYNDYIKKNRKYDSLIETLSRNGLYDLQAKLICLNYDHVMEVGNDLKNIFNQVEKSLGLKTYNVSMNMNMGINYFIKIGLR